MKDKLSDAQLAALISARNYGNPAFHLNGRGEYGAYCRNTGPSLHRRGYLKNHKLTKAGRAALQALGYRPERRV